ncbi:MAG TPA: helix-turn-helix domain-containing protein, partial [Phenylobacterium sp.]|nr:helix-turn-helix domain-containing protein [Phenylobacterium sp.]
MPRLPGQIDKVKSRAILDAAVVVLGEGGLSTPMDEIARRAGVSKQTIYNHFGSKADLIRAIVERRVEEIA